MESHTIFSQVQTIKGNLARQIIMESVAHKEPVIFSSTVFHMDPMNPYRVFSIYGIDKGMLMFDTHMVGTESLELNSLEVETMARVKEQMEFSQKSRQYSRD